MTATGADRSRFLLVLAPGDGNARPVSTIAPRLADAGGRILAASPAAANARLEPGTGPCAIVLAQFPSQQALEAAWTTVAQSGPLPADLTALAGDCEPEGSGADFPSRARAAPVARKGRPAYMVVRGRVTAPEPIGRYRAIIFPMISERGGYYLAYAGRDQLACLAGRFEEQALIVSRWPDWQAAEDFWFCERYQLEAIPTRSGAGVFSVLLAPGLDGE